MGVEKGGPMKKHTTAHAMSPNLVTISAYRPIAEARDLMEEKGIRHLPVVDSEGLVIGILSDRDVNRAMSPVRPGFMGGSAVSDFMSWPAITVDEGMPLAEVAEGMLDEKVSSFLVTRGGREVVGIITSDDLLKVLRNLLRGETKSPLKALPYSPVVREALNEIQSVGL
jgi:CBS domain-containing protein